ncbi:MAG: UDP-N-acetylmuramyl-tripeptide synthetase [Candidatus Choladocola sp.]|nr:UDP-N-acetylmuramyl-tripeptide synthetase [Candidatus Choladocola sp.]
MKTFMEIANLLRERGLLKEVKGNESNPVIRWISCDSRKVVSGTLFICKGAAFRPEYLQEAADRGSTVYLCEYVLQTNQELCGLIVTDIRKAMAVVSAAFFAYETDRPVLTGITGTKGKTTTAWYLKAMLDLWEKERNCPETGLISTVENYDGKERSDAVMTTPESPVIHEMLANARDAGIRYVTMEVSSQALKYKRVRELRFKTGIFLNISEDHISPQEHTDFEDYFSSKLSIFRQTETACVNLDSDFSDRILKVAKKTDRIITFGKHPDADLRCSEIQVSGNRISFLASCDRFSEKFTLAMKGSFNIENAMAAIAAGYAYGVPVHCMQEALATTKVPGRMETFFSRSGKICGIVDFAHNRLSFEKLYDAVFQEYTPYRKIITVFGCPGGKALNRRRELGLLAGLFSDTVIVTSDDPGMECPEAIAEEIRGYAEMTGCPCLCVEERMKAVETAVRIASENEENTIVLLLGRGCEKFQKIGGQSLAYPTDASIMRWAIESCDDCCRFITAAAIS